MRVKYNRVSTLQQTGNRFEADKEIYDLVLLDKVSGSIPFRERQEAKTLVSLVVVGKVNELVVEELSRLGRSMADVIQTLEWLDNYHVNVCVRNLGIQSRPDGKKNPIWNIITATLSGLYAMELENIKERTTTGRMIFVQKGGKLGRPKGTNESTRDFLAKESSQQITKYLHRRLSLREISKLTNCSTRTVQKVKNLMDNNY